MRKESRLLFQKVEDEADPLSDPNKDWVDYWRNLFPKVIKTK